MIVESLPILLNLEMIWAKVSKNCRLNRILLERNYSHEFIVKTNRFITKDDGEQVEIDVYSENPNIIMECTTFLKANELKKVKKFVETKKYLEKKKNTIFESYFVTYGINRSIRD